MQPSIETVWARIVGLEGEAFETKTGKPFTFEIVGGVLHPSRTDYSIGRSEFGKALECMPSDGPGAITDLVRGPSYVWAILSDSRVRRGDW